MRLLCCIVLLSSLLAVTDAFGRAPFFFGAHGLALGRGNGSVKAEPCAPEPMSEVKQCLADFYAIYDFDIMHMPDEYTFSSKVFKIMHQGKEGIQSVCKNSNALTACLAKVKRADDCKNGESYTAILGLSSEQSMSYLQDNVYFGYWCAHEQIFEDNFDCMMNPEMELKLQMHLCLEVFMIEQQLGMDECLTVNGFQICATMAFDHACGADLDKCMCESMQAQLGVTMPQCTGKLFDCSIPFGSRATAMKPRMPSRRLKPLKDALRYDVY